VTGTGTITFSGCTVELPENKGCVITGSTISTNTLTGTTVGHVRVTAPGILAAVPISGCENAVLNNIWAVEGSLVVNVSGATGTVTHTGVTAQETLEFGGVEAGLEGALTLTTGSEHFGITLT
jgi:hypothetical protein